MNKNGFISNKCPKCGIRMDIAAPLIGTLVHCRECNANFAAPATGIVEGTVIGDIWFHKKIGSSVRSDVFLAKILSSDTQVAVKVLCPFLNLKIDQLQAFVARFKARELREHPVIVPYTDTGIANAHLYIMSDYLEVEDLKAQLRRIGTIPEGKLLHVASQVAETLNFCWEKYRVCHGTIKPANLMLENSRSVRVPELGLYNLLARQGNHPSENDTEDTAYASPEQENGGLADSRSDIYALGATLYHLATGAKPLSPRQARELMGDRTDSPLFPAANEINPKLSLDFADFLNRLLVLDPQQRPQTWTEVQYKLEDLKSRVAAGTETQTVPVRTQGSGIHKAAVADAEAVDNTAAAPPSPASASGKKRKKSRKKKPRLVRASQNAEETSPGWFLPFLAGCLILLISSFVYFGVSYATQQARIRAEAESAEDEARTRQQEKLDALGRRFNEAMEFTQNNPEDYEAAIERFTRIRTQGVGTPYQKLAHDQILTLRSQQRLRRTENVRPVSP